VGFVAVVVVSLASVAPVVAAASVAPVVVAADSVVPSTAASVDPVVPATVVASVDPVVPKNSAAPVVPTVAASVDAVLVAQFEIAQALKSVFVVVSLGQQAAKQAAVSSSMVAENAAESPETVWSANALYAPKNSVQVHGSFNNSVWKSMHSMKNVGIVASPWAFEARGVLNTAATMERRLRCIMFNSFG
jgi:hypothetical protein